ncbi:hypothetical protein, partial [Actinomadura sp. NPDC049753]|uniref:hypothetical protein n=1 Tax=Actinomadura sp. NPDC049753 TaxID=3154739 RepID=UPI003421930D
ADAAAGRPVTEAEVRKRLAAALVLLAVVGFLVLRPDGPPGNVATTFSDDFSNDGSDWGTFNGQYGYMNGGYRLETQGSTGAVRRDVPKDDFAPDPMLATVTTRVAQGSPDGMYGLTCRMTEDGANEYMFLVRNDGKGAVLRKLTKDRGTKELDSTDSVPGLSEGESNKLQIACESGNDGKQVRLRLWVNGHRVVDATDTDQPLGNGKAGLQVERGGNAAQQIIVDFDDFDLSKILD